MHQNPSVRVSEPTWRTSLVRHLESDSPPPGKRPRVTILGIRYYGAPIGLEPAKKVMAAAEAEAVKNNWGMAIAILDSTGHIVMLQN